MTSKLLSYAAYLPSNVLDRSTLTAAAGGAGGPGGRSVSSYDEDPVTMGVAAARQLVGVADGSPLYFATSMPPFMDKSNATIVRAALGWDEHRPAIDLLGLRSGLTGLGLSAATGGVTVMGDSRNGRVGSGEEADGGDGGAAFLFGDSDDAVAQVLGTASLSTEIMDVWRVPGEEYAGFWEERFSQHVLSRSIDDAVTAVMKLSGIGGTATTTLVASPHRRFALGSAAAIGSSGSTEVLARHRSEIGYCGAADIGVLLAAALDSSRAGDTILLVDAVGGAGTMLLEVLRDGPGSHGITEHLRSRRSLSYVDFLTWSGRLERQPARRPDRPSVAAPPAARKVAWKYALVGGECRGCGKVYLPAQRVCGACGATDRQVPHSVLHRTGRIAAVTTDGVSDTPAPPAIAATVDFDGGGRLLMEVADVAVDGISVGDDVTPVFRRTYEVGGVPNYFWKARQVSGRLQ